MKKLFIALFASLGLLAGVTATAAPAHASARIPTCPSRTTCMFQNANYNGIEHDYDNPTEGSTWISLSTADRASVIEGGQSDVWFWNRSAQLYHCVVAGGSDGDLTFPGGFGDPGYMFIDYGVNDGCFEPHPSGAPGS